MPRGGIDCPDTVDIPKADSTHWVGTPPSRQHRRSGMDPGDGGGLTGRDAQPYAAHISP